MSKRYKLVVFDWEGTLGDTIGPIIHSLHAEAHRLHLGEMDESLARQYLTLGLVIAIKKTFPNATLTVQEQLIQAVQYALVSRSAEVYLLPGAKELVEELYQKGFDVGIASNKGQQSLQRSLQSSGIEGFISSSRSASQVPPKPCPQMLLEIMEECGVEAKDTVMIGDASTDIEMAASAGVDSIGVNFYYQKELENELLNLGALAVFDDFRQVASFLKLHK
jgi:phosphoglycolate phosphatase